LRKIGSLIPASEIHVLPFMVLKLVMAAHGALLFSTESAHQGFSASGGQ
jgi:hypothetical protein